MRVRFSDPLPVPCPHSWVMFGGMHLAFVNFVTSRRWQNIAKYFFDVSKLVIGISVISQLVAQEMIQWKAVAFGTLTGVVFMTVGVLIDRRGDDNQ